MDAPKRSIFRSSAIQNYVQSQEKDVLPQFVTPPVFAFLWCLSGLLFVALLSAWWGKVPTYTTGTGAIAGNSNDTAIVFLPPEQLSKLKIGQKVDLQVGMTGKSWQVAIAEVEPNILSPQQLRSQYQLDPAALLAVTQPSAVVKVKLTGTSLTSTTYTGSIFTAQVQVGSRRVISFLPILEQVGGEASE